jgi:hypothetical protein
MREIAHNWISPVRIKVNASQIAVATAGAAQPEDRSAKQKTTFFDSIGLKFAFERGHPAANANLRRRKHFVATEIADMREDKIIPSPRPYRSAVAKTDKHAPAARHWARVVTDASAKPETGRHVLTYSSGNPALLRSNLAATFLHFQ